MSDAAGRLFVSDDRGCVRSVTAEGQTEPFLELPAAKKRRRPAQKQGIYTTDRKAASGSTPAAAYPETIARFPASGR